MTRKDSTALRDEAAKAIERGKLDRAIELYIELEGLEPTSPAWSKRLAETYRRKGDVVAAIAAFERAVVKYVDGGFVVQAIAVCKLILQIDPRHSATATMLAQLAPAPVRAATPEPAPLVAAPRAPSSPPVPPSTPAPRGPTVRAPTSPIEEAPVRRAPVVRAPTSPGDEGQVRRAPLRAPTASGDEPPTPRSPVPRPPTPPPTAARPAPPPPPPPPPPRPPAPPAKTRPSDGLDALELATVVPRAKPFARTTGSNYGINVLPLDDEPVVEVGFDDLEPPTQHRARAKTASVLASTPLFSDMSPGVLDSLVPRMTLVVLEPSEVLFREGEPGDCLYVVSEGEVVVTTNGQELARFGPGSFFGEVALITDQPRTATITAVTRVEVLSIDRETVRAAAAEQPEIVTVLLRFVRERLIDRMTRTSALFQSFTDDERAALTSRFDLLEVSQDVHLIIEGQRADGLYVIVAGKVEVWRDGAHTPIALLSTGDVFGEMSLLGDGPATASCTTASRAIALRLSAPTFREVIMTHPQVLAYLADLDASRTPPTAGDDLVGVHLDLL